MSRHTISNSDDIIDSRDVIRRISDLESELEDRFNEDTRVECGSCGGSGTVEHAIDDNVEDGAITADCEDCDGEGTVASGDTFEEWLVRMKDESDDDAEELIALRELAEEGEGSPDWQHGETLIRDDYFETYAQDLHEDINGRDSGKGWPFDHIDWEAAADALKVDYMSVEYGDTTYWIRA